MQIVNNIKGLKAKYMTTHSIYRRIFKFTSKIKMQILQQNFLLCIIEAFSASEIFLYLTQSVKY